MEFPQTRLLLAQFGNKAKSHHYQYQESNISCVPEDCNSIIVKYDCSCAKPLLNTTCHGTSDSTIPIVLWSISAFILLLLIFELFLIRFGFSFLDNFFGKLVYKMGITSSVVTQFCTMHYLQENSHGITVWYNVCLGGISTFFVVFGYQFLFVSSRKDNIGSHDRGMGLVVAIITVLLVGLEAVLICTVYMREDLSAAIALYLLVFSCEKIVQVVIYFGVRRCKPHEDDKLKRGAVFYLNSLSFVNFTLWLNSIPFEEVEIYKDVSDSHILQIVDVTFKALVLDYRLLCALLFLEHALAIDQECENPHVEVDDEFQMPRERYLYTMLGAAVGLGLLGLQAGNAAQFWNKSVPFFVSLFPILSDIGLVVLGCKLLVNVGTPVLHRKKVSLVSFMVTTMGAISIVYLFCFGLLSLTTFRHDKPVTYIKWSGCVFLSRGLSLLFLLLVYTGVPVSTMESKENFTKSNYFYVSALCWGLFARFIGCILDEFCGVMDEIAAQHLASNNLRTLQDLFAIGPLFQLAAVLHLALHFLLVLCRLYEQPNKVVQAERLEDAGQRNRNVGRKDGDAEPIRGTYGAVNPANVAIQPNGFDAAQPNSSINAVQPSEVRSDAVDSDFESSGVHQFRSGNDESLPIIDERTPLLHTC